MNTRQEEGLVPPPSSLFSRNPLKWFRFFGPGAILASVTIGSGELIFPSRGGAMFGYNLLWIFLVISLMKWALAYGSLRHLILSGGHPFSRWSYIPGPRGWFPLLMFILVAPFFPVWISFIAGVLGTACTWIFGVGNLYLWASIAILVVTFLLFMGTYDILEKVQTLILGAMLICVIIAVLYVRPDWWAAATGLLFPKALQYPEWALEKFPHLRERSEWVEILVYVSTIGGTSHNYLSYISLSRNKKWGRSHLEIANEKQLDLAGSQKDHLSKIWLRAGLVDTTLSFVMVIIFSSCFCILGRVILQPKQLIPDGVDLLNHQGTFLTELSPWLLPLYMVAVLMTFFGSLYGAPEMHFRVVYEYINSLPRWRNRFPLITIRRAVIAYGLGGGLIILLVSQSYPEVQLIDIVTPAGIFTGVIGCGLYCLANPWVDRRFLPPNLRMPKSLALLNIFGGLVLSLAGFRALWNYGQFSGYIIVMLALSLCLLLTWRFPFYNNPGRTG